MGSLLTQLYPGKLSPTEVLRYFGDQSRSIYWHIFTVWVSKVPNISTNSQLAELLDAIVQDYQQLTSEFVGSEEQVNPLRRVPSPTEGFLETSDKNIFPNRLLKWLKIVSVPELRESPDQVEFIRTG